MMIQMAASSTLSHGKCTKMAKLVKGGLALTSRVYRDKTTQVSWLSSLRLNWHFRMTSFIQTMTTWRLSTSAWIHFSLRSLELGSWYTNCLRMMRNRQPCINKLSQSWRKRFLGSILIVKWERPSMVRRLAVIILKVNMERLQLSHILAKELKLSTHWTGHDSKVNGSNFTAQLRILTTTSASQMKYLRNSPKDSGNEKSLGKCK